jgi:acetolactate synthase-1/2/3 large subunit
LKLSDAVITRLADLGVSQAFAVTGGAAMHLNISLGNNSKINTVYMHHEQSCSMAAEGYARVAGKPAIVNVTSGPGALNAFNGIFGAYTDSVPMLVVAGQSRTDTLINYNMTPSLRQLGDQEVQSLVMVKEITKERIEITKQDSFGEVIAKVDNGYRLSLEGRPGPVWIEIPVDVQAREFPDVIMPPVLKIPLEVHDSNLDIEFLIEKLGKSNRPIFMFGTGVRIANVQNQLIAIAEEFSIPVVTAWTHDTIDTENGNFVGRAGTIGTRPGNISVQQCDFLVVFGSRLNIRQVSYNWDSFAKNAVIVQIDIDVNELKKPFPRIDLPICADLRNFAPNFANQMENFKFNFGDWLTWCKNIKERYDVKNSDYATDVNSINVYHIVPAIIDNCPPETVIVCGNATACIVPFQTARIRDQIRMFSNSGSASMGYDLPAAIGASLAGARNVLCFAGDGSIMLNIQELQTLKHLQLNIKVVILDNGGYLSIKQTQQNFFGSRFGADQASGVSFPNFTEIAKAFGLDAIVVDSDTWREDIREIYKSNGPTILIVKLDASQEFQPRLKSRMVEGKIVTPELDDMFPFLKNEEVIEFREAPLKIRSKEIK